MSKARCDAGRKGGFAPRWERSDIESMVTLYLEGTSNREMAILLNRSVPQVKGMMSRFRKQRGLPFRDQEHINETRKKTIEMGGLAAFPTPLDKAWQGCVPLGHWMITKKWSQGGVSSSNDK